MVYHERSKIDLVKILFLEQDFSKDSKQMNHLMKIGIVSKHPCISQYQHALLNKQYHLFSELPRS